MLNIDNLMLSLTTNRCVFHSEADFQHALAWEIHNQYSNCIVRLEYNPNIVRVNDSIHIDIFVKDRKEKYAIELKYKTKLGRYFVNNEQYNVKSHSAHDCARYDFMKDIMRLEKLKEIDNYKGYAIFLTNEKLYWNNKKVRQNTIDSAFRFHDGVLIDGIMRWKKGTNPNTMMDREKAIKISNQYKIVWKDYSDITNMITNENDKFRYVCIKI